jgi:hypothetical protein
VLETSSSSAESNNRVTTTTAIAQRRNRRNSSAPSFIQVISRQPAPWPVLPWRKNTTNTPEICFARTGSLRPFALMYSIVVCQFVQIRYGIRCANSATKFLRKIPESPSYPTSNDGVSFGLRALSYRRVIYGSHLTKIPNF